eukprot:9713764-Karenia_brevis.AAC.1
MSFDWPELQCAIKQCSRGMSKPKVVSWRSVKKKVARYLVGVERVVWKFGWQDRVAFSRVFSDRDWWGNCRDRKSTSGGVWTVSYTHLRAHETLSDL